MTSSQDHNKVGASPIVLSIDAMGGDLGPEAVVSGMSRSAKANPDIRFLVHGPKSKLERLIERKKPLAGRCEIRDATGVVSMEDKPSHIMRHGQDTSMWAAIEAVRNKEATVAVSCGNTGALMALSMIRLRKLPGVNRPAIAILWPSRNPQGFNVMLDVGADVKADAQDLLQYALMGVSYARNGLALDRPRVGLLNVGTEEHKGRAELKQAHELITQVSERAQFDFVGFVEGGDIPGEACDRLKEAFAYSPLSRLASLLALTSLRRLKKKIDPRRVNGGVFLGLNGTVVKSHGSADETGVSAAIKLAFQLAQSGFSERLAARLASITDIASENATETSTNEESPK